MIHLNIKSLFSLIKKAGPKKKTGKMGGLSSGSFTTWTQPQTVKDKDRKKN